MAFCHAKTFPAPSAPNMCSPVGEEAGQPPLRPTHPNQEGDTCICERTSGLMAESVYGGDIQSISTDH